MLQLNEYSKEDISLSISQLNKHYIQESGKKLCVLKDIDLKVNKQEFVTLIGPSGCGKSTLLNIIAGLINPDSGQVLLNGEIVKSPGRDRVMVFQEAALFPWLTVLDNVLFGLKTNGHDRKESYSRALKQLAAVQLADFKDAYPHQLSGGMKQRAAIARAFVMDPEILLMDEPFGALDEQTRMILQQELINLWLKSKKTIIFVTHNIREAVKLSDRIIVFGTKPGRVIGEIPVNIPRPRSHESSTLIKTEKMIRELLKMELDEKGGLTNETITA